MKEQKATVREFLRNFKKFSKSGKVTVVFNRSEPEGVFVPYDEWEKGKEKEDELIDWSILKKYTFGGDFGHLSDPNEIDKICYFDES